MKKLFLTATLALLSVSALATTINVDFKINVASAYKTNSEKGTNFQLKRTFLQEVLKMDGHVDGQRIDYNVEGDFTEVPAEKEILTVLSKSKIKVIDKDDNVRKMDAQVSLNQNRVNEIKVSSKIYKEAYKDSLQKIGLSFIQGKLDINIDGAEVKVTEDSMSVRSPEMNINMKFNVSGLKCERLDELHLGCEQSIGFNMTASNE